MERHNVPTNKQKGVQSISAVQETISAISWDCSMAQCLTIARRRCYLPVPRSGKAQPFGRWPFAIGGWSRRGQSELSTAFKSGI